MKKELSIMLLFAAANSKYAKKRSFNTNFFLYHKKIGIYCTQKRIPCVFFYFHQRTIDNWTTKLNWWIERACFMLSCAVYFCAFFPPSFHLNNYCYSLFLLVSLLFIVIVSYRSSFFWQFQCKLFSIILMTQEKRKNEKIKLLFVFFICNWGDVL